ncbi:MAG: hypothetical protein KAX99_08965, partial [Azonexus sp.]|nr:hypothetical protein [Azonexus sp.]
HAFQSCDFFLSKASAGGTFRHLYYHWKTRLGTIREHWFMSTEVSDGDIQAARQWLVAGCHPAQGLSD